MLKKDGVGLRAPEMGDLELLYQWENNIDNWPFSDVYSPFSKYSLKQFIEMSKEDIALLGQKRFMIDDLSNNVSIGCVDVFELSLMHKRAGVGILIDTAQRNKGFASKALNLLITYAQDVLQLHQLHADINANNKQSLYVFQQAGFVISGIKKDWLWLNHRWQDQVHLQKII